ncbi:AzlD domain-containing protein [Aliiroseovarius sp. S1123]|jgi:branched-subunit amino acid transport protein|uniref:AzlD domain-containing protein n=1 Tax=unclassified Aliiroseovarius TaxID=2623558 RepID=UPI001FF23DAB|nr:AzlD domain-containing protein [Aliiroseovarius sp. S1123]MCK0171665.1 AzlD domain-containing protein [Aliiroseovarius sp. S1123]
MDQLNHTTVWFVIFAMAIGSFLIRFSFLGIIGDRQMPEWVLRHLRYTPVAVLPGLVAPLVLWPAATEGSPDPARLGAALVTLAVGYFSKNVLAAILSGAATLYGLLFLLG